MNPKGLQSKLTREKKGCYTKSCEEHSNMKPYAVDIHKIKISAVSIKNLEFLVSHWSQTKAFSSIGPKNLGSVPFSMVLHHEEIDERWKVINEKFLIVLF